MEMRQFYKKIKELEEGIKSEEVIVVSNETPDGGIPGIKTEVKRSLAARMLAEGKVRLGTDEEAQLYQMEKEACYKRAQELISSSRVQLAVLTEAEMKAIKSTLKSR